MGTFFSWSGFFWGGNPKKRSMYDWYIYVDLRTTININVGKLGKYINISYLDPMWLSKRPHRDGRFGIVLLRVCLVFSKSPNVSQLSHLLA